MFLIYLPIIVCQVCQDAPLPTPGPQQGVVVESLTGRPQQVTLGSSTEVQTDSEVQYDSVTDYPMSHDPGSEQPATDESIWRDFPQIHEHIDGPSNIEHADFELPEGYCPGGPLVTDGTGPSIDSEENLDQGLPRLVPALLSLRSNASAGTEVFSGGSRWTKVSYQPLEFIAALPADQTPGTVRFWVNGLPADPSMFTLQSEWEPNELNQIASTWTWSCPPLGKTIVQLEYQIGDRWSGLSAPVRFEVVPPMTPVAIAVGSSANGLNPVQQPHQVFEANEILVVQFSDVASGATVVADVAGYESIHGSPQLHQCSFGFALVEKLPLGRYEITFRQIQTSNCDVSSLSSRPIVVEFRNVSNRDIVIDNLKSARRYELIQETNRLIQQKEADHIKALKSSLNETREVNGGDPGHYPAHPQVEWQNRVKNVEQIKAGLEEREKNEDSIYSQLQTQATVATVDFDSPAIFSSHRHAFYRSGAIQGDLTLLEGMRVSTSANGNYRMEFKYIAPQMPTILHMQVQFFSEADQTWKSLTLAPITIRPIDYKEPDMMVQQVVREGYSAALERVGGHVKQMRRRGTAVSGYGLSDSRETYQF